MKTALQFLTIIGLMAAATWLIGLWVWTALGN